MRIPYKKYNIEEARNSENTKKEVIHIEYENHGLKCLLSYYPAYFSFGDHQTAHLNFYALSEGWNAFTETGYRSTFLTVERDFKATKKEIVEYFESLFKEVNFDVQAPIQASLF